MHPLVERARQEGTPLIDGETVTFVWHGSDVPLLITDFHDWEANPQSLHQVDSDVWAYSMELPRQAYLEYAYYDAFSGERPGDPFNPRRVPNGLGRINQFFFMPEAKETPLVEPDPRVPHGQVTYHYVEGWEFAASETRRVNLYKPPTDEPTPLLVVYDGQDFLGRGKLPIILDNLIAQKRIRPLSLAMVANDSRVRMMEYACSEMTLGLLVYGVLPLADRYLNLIDLSEQPGAYGILGASMGGLMSLYTGLRMPEIFGHVISLSGAFSITDHEFVIFDLVRYTPRQQLDLWMNVGLFEHLLESNREMHRLLVEKGWNVAYREYQGGHNYTSWRNEIWRALEHLYPNNH